jgi:hypothetical protein
MRRRSAGMEVLRAYYNYVLLGADERTLAKAFERECRG